MPATSNTETQTAQAPTDTDELLAAITQRQGDKSARAFARELCLPHTTYIETVQGIRPVGISFLEAIAHRYPELDPLIGDHLRSRSERAA